MYIHTKNVQKSTERRGKEAKEKKKEEIKRVK
jgi:hypothetical protein